MSVEEYSRSLVAAIYARRSKVGDDTLSVDNQVAHLKKYAEKMGYRIDDKLIFVDNGYSAYSGVTRPAFEEMMLVAKDEHRPMDVILVHMFDRFYRNVDEATIEKAILRSRYNVDVKGAEEELPDDPMMARIMEVVTDSASQKYSAKLSKRVRDGYRSLAMAGCWTTNKPPYGYRCEECNTASGRKSKRLAIHDEEAAIVLQAFQLAAKNYTPNEIERRLPELNVTSGHLKRMFKNLHYTGVRVVREKRRGPVDHIVENSHPAIIDQQLFDQVQASLKRRNKKTSTSKKTYTANGKRLFSGLINCSCGYSMPATQAHGWKNGKTVIYYRCNAPYQKKKHPSVKGVSQDQLLDLIYDKLSNDLLSDAVIEQAIADIKDKRKNGAVARGGKQLKNDLVKNKMRQERLKTSIEMGIVSLDEIKERMDKLKEEASEVSLKLSLTSQPVDDLKLGDIQQLARHIKRRLKSKNSDHQYESIRQIVTGITVDFPWITLKVNFANIEEEYRFNYYPKPSIPDDLSSLHPNDINKLAGKIRRYENDTTRTWRDERESRIANEEYINDYLKKTKQNRTNS